MKKMRKLLTACLLVLAPVTANADPPANSDSKVVVEVRQVDQAAPKSTVQQASEWVGLGKEVGEAINEGLGALTAHASEFAGTDVGKFTMFLIAWKVIGNDFIQLILGMLWFWIVGAVIFWSWWCNARTRRILVREAKGEEPAQYKVVEATVDAMWGHALTAAIHLALTALITFL